MFRSYLLKLSHAEASIVLFLFTFSLTALVIVVAVVMHDRAPLATHRSFGSQWGHISEHVKDRVEIGDAFVRTPSLPVAHTLYTAQALTITNSAYIPILSNERLRRYDLVSITRLSFDDGGDIYLATRKPRQRRE